LERKARKGGAREGLGLENDFSPAPNAGFGTALGRPDCGLVAESGTDMGGCAELGLQKKNNNKFRFWGGVGAEKNELFGFFCRRNVRVGGVRLLG
jgi:hypothetical protein